MYVVFYPAASTPSFNFDSGNGTTPSNSFNFGSSGGAGDGDNNFSFGSGNDARNRKSPPMEFNFGGGDSVANQVGSSTGSMFGLFGNASDKDSTDQRDAAVGAFNLSFDEVTAPSQAAGMESTFSLF